LQLLARAVGRLPEDYRAAFLLRAEEGLPFRQIAQVLGIKEETARWRVFKARQKLMGLLAPQLDRERV
jgi:RNA polymerase sigma-70 factor (ECF subfamily)